MDARTHSSVSQNSWQLKHFSKSAELRFFRVLVDVTTSVNCIKLIDQAVRIKCTIVRLR